MRGQRSPNPQKRAQTEAGAQTVISASPVDVGRSAYAITIEAQPSAVAETLMSMAISVDGAATASASSHIITSGKRFRFQFISLYVEAVGTGVYLQRAYLRLRSQPTGSLTAASPLQAVLAAGINDAAVKASDHAALPIYDGFELAGDGNRSFGFTLECPDYIATTGELKVKATMIGFEY